jgi:hypothetical protein
MLISREDRVVLGQRGSESSVLRQRGSESSVLRSVLLGEWVGPVRARSSLGK